MDFLSFALLTKNERNVFIEHIEENDTDVLDELVLQSVNYITNEEIHFCITLSIDGNEYIVKGVSWKN